MCETEVQCANAERGDGNKAEVKTKTESKQAVTKKAIIDTYNNEFQVLR